MKFEKQLYPVLIDGNYIPELTSVEVTSTGVRIGASVSLSSVSDYLKQIMQMEPGRLSRLGRKAVRQTCVRNSFFWGWRFGVIGQGSGEGEPKRRKPFEGAL